AFILFLFVLHRLLPGKKVAGQPLPGSGERLTYKINGMALFVATHMLIFSAAWFFDVSLTPLLEQFWSLLVAANIITFAWLALMYRAGWKRLAAQAKAGIEDEETSKRGWLARLWYGIELNPKFLG